jgi:peptidoglycan/xylan/chitin deacetylase (PgdA/CDA1 family)
VTLPVWIAGAAVASAVVYTAGAQVAARLGAVVRCGPHTMRVALTFDDGPHPAFTPRLLDILASHGVRASFFLIGRHAEEEAAITRAVAESGHDVGSHTYSHRHLWTLGPAATRDEILRGRDAVARVTGANARYFRPPWGMLNAAVLRVCRAEGLTPVLWTVRAEGYRWRPSVERMVQEVVGRSHPGAIVGLHDRGGFRDTPRRVLEALPGILSGLRARCLEPVTLSELLGSNKDSRE